MHPGKDVLVGIGLRQSETQRGFSFPHRRADFQEVQPDSIELRVGEHGSRKQGIPEGMKERIGGAVQEEPEGIGIKAMAGGPVTGEVEFEFFDKVLHLAPAAVQDLVDRHRSEGGDVGHHEAGIESLFGHLRHADDPELPMPGSGLVLEFGETAVLLREYLVAAADNRGEGIHALGEGGIAGESEDIADLMGVAEGEHFGSGIMRIAPHHDDDLRPGLPDTGDNPFEDGADFLAGGPFARAENGGDELAALSFEDEHGFEAESVVIAVEEGELLGAMGGVLGVVEVQDDMVRRSLVGGDEEVNRSISQAAQIFGGDGVLQTGKRGLTGQVLFGRKPVAGGFERGVQPEGVGVVGVFISAGNLEDTLQKQVTEGMGDIAGMPGIVNGANQMVCQSDTLGNFPQFKHSGIGSDLLTGEVHDHFFPGNTCKWKRKLGIFSHAVQPPNVSILSISIARNSNILNYLHDCTAFFMNNPG